MSANQDEALEVLRAVWRARGQSTTDLADELGESKSCKRMTDVGFDDFAGGEEDRTAAWRATLEREGKLRDTGSVRDLVRGPADLVRGSADSR
jgi:hypothetical protein